MKKALHVFLLLLAAQVGWVGVYHLYGRVSPSSKASQEEMYENGDIARSLNAGTGFSLPTHPFFRGPTAHKPPLYPALMALVMRVSGDHAAAVLRVFQLLLTAAGLTALWSLFAERFGEGVGRRAILFWSASPALAKASVYFETTALAIFLSALFFRSFWAVGRDGRPAPAPAGLSLGAACLANATFLAFIPVAAAALWRRSRSAALLLLGAAALVVLPWTLRNRAAFGRWIPVTSNFLYEVWIGNNDGATGALTTAAGETIGMLPAGWEGLEGMREPEAYRAFGGKAGDFIRRNPGRFLVLRAKAAFYFFFTSRPWILGPRPVDAVNVAVAAATVLAGFSGLLALLRRGHPDAAAWACFILAFSAVYAATHGDTIDRYRLPLDPLLLGFAACLGRKDAAA